MNELTSAFEPEFRFTDITILEAHGQYQDALAIMREAREPFPWCLRTHLTLLHPLGASEMELEFHSDRRVVIVDFHPSVRDPVVNIDLRCLRAWTAANDWEIPQPHHNIVDSATVFWKHMWSVNSVISPELDLRYGKREELEEKEQNVQRDDGQEIL